MEDNTQWIISIRFRGKSGTMWQAIAGMMYGVVQRGWGLWMQHGAYLYWSGSSKTGVLSGLIVDLGKWHTLVIRRNLNTLVFHLRTEGTATEKSLTMAWSTTLSVHQQKTLGGQWPSQNENFVGDVSYIKFAHTKPNSNFERRCRFF